MENHEHGYFFQRVVGGVAKGEYLQTFCGSCGKRLFEERLED